MAAGRTLTVNLVANTRSFTRGMFSAVQNAEGFRGKIGAVATTMKKVLGPAMIAAAAAASALAVKMGVDGVKAAMSNERTAAVLARTLEGLGKAHEAAGVERFIAQLESSTGIIDDKLRPALGRLLIATGDVGQAQDLLTKALDVAVGTGKDFTGVVDAISRAVQTGTAGSLSRYGVVVNKNASETKGFTAALNEALDAFGGLQAAEAKTLEGQLRILKVEADNVKEAFGRGLINAFTDSRGSIDSMSESLRDLQEGAEALGESLGNTLQVFGEFVRWSKVIAGSSKEAGDETAWWQTALGGLWDIVHKFGRGPFGNLVDAAWAYGEAAIAARDATNRFEHAAFAAAMQGVAPLAKSMEDLNEETKEVVDTFLELNGLLDKRAGLRNYQAAVDKLRDSMEKNGVAFGRNTDAARDNESALDNIFKSAEKVATGHDTARAKVRVMEDALRDAQKVLDASGVPRDAQERLLKPFVDSIEKIKETEIAAGNLRGAIEDIPSRKDVFINFRTNWDQLPAAAKAEFKGGRVPGMATGGLVKGRGGPMSDMVPAMLSNGEFVVRAQAVNSFGADFFQALNRGINPLRGVDRPSTSERGGASRTMVIENINVTAATNEAAEVTVPRALRRLAWVSGLDG